jgi:hypothetical protein
MAKMPVRFEYQPDLGYAIPREVPVTDSEGDVIGALSSIEHGPRRPPIRRRIVRNIPAQSASERDGASGSLQR